MFITEFTEWIRIKKKGSNGLQCHPPRWQKSHQRVLPCTKHKYHPDTANKLWRSGRHICDSATALLKCAKPAPHALCRFEPGQHFAPYLGKIVSIAGTSFAPIWSHFHIHLNEGKRKVLTACTFLGGFMVHFIVIDQRFTQISGHRFSATPPTLSAAYIQSHSKKIQSQRKAQRQRRGQTVGIDINTNDNDNNDNDDNNNNNERRGQRIGTDHNMNNLSERPEIDPHQQRRSEYELGHQRNIHGQDLGPLPTSGEETDNVRRNIMDDLMEDLRESMDELDFGNDENKNQNQRNTGKFTRTGSVHFLGDNIIDNIAYCHVERPDPTKVMKSYVRPGIKSSKITR